MVTLAIVLGGCAADVSAQTIFNQNFDGGYAGSFETSSYSGGSPTSCTNYVLPSGGTPNGCWRATMTATTWSDYYAGQMGLMTVSGNTDPNPSDYVLSFDARGSQAATFQFMIQTWPDNYFGGSGPVINVSMNDELTAANAWQTFSVNLGSLTSASPTGATWQLAFQLNSWQWGGPGLTDTLTIDNILLTQVRGLALTSSANASPVGGSVTFTATVQTNGLTASNAAGEVVFSSANGAFSTNLLSGGSATSSSITNLPVGTDLITAIYSGGNYPALTNTISYVVTAPPQDNLLIYSDNLVNGFQNWSWATVNLTNNSTAHSGVYSISVTDAGNQALAFEHSDFNTSPYVGLTFLGQWWQHWRPTVAGLRITGWHQSSGLPFIGFTGEYLAANPHSALRPACGWQAQLQRLLDPGQLRRGTTHILRGRRATGGRAVAGSGSFESGCRAGSADRGCAPIWT